ncbi:unannotated protein [freshwater metagenome]|uniref:Unannotated protein n=1 Tax=freshwater metagenome TaxID=449393 RepID=A0A6J7Y331_9ZZZZ
MVPSSLPAKASIPMSVTLSGIVTLDKFVPSNAFAPIVSKPSGKSTEVTSVLPRNAPSAMCFTSAGIRTLPTHCEPEVRVSPTIS